MADVSGPSPPTSSSSSSSTTSISTQRRKLVMGTTGWTDPSLARCGKFFPPSSSRSAEDRLRYYSTQFPCVEVDSSNYAIPAKSSVQRWLSCVPKPFVFHFKAFGFFCSKSCTYGALPYQIKNQLQCPADSTVQLSSLSEDQKCLLWQIFNDALLPVHRAASLGTVVFQFHLTFKPSDEHRAHVMWCRNNLDSRYPMAVEFRCRDWFDDKNAPATVEWLSHNRIALVAADELEHETFLKGRMTDSPVHTILPVAWACTDPSYMYIRLHRREGTERILSSRELSTWEDRLKKKLPPALEGPVYMLWGTMWEDQAVNNSKNLAQGLGDMVLDWKAVYLASSKSNLQRFFKLPSSDGSNRVPRLGTDHEERNDEAPNSQSPTLCPGTDCGTLVSPQAREQIRDPADQLAEPFADGVSCDVAQEKCVSGKPSFREDAFVLEDTRPNQSGDDKHSASENDRFEMCHLQNSASHREDDIVSTVGNDIHAQGSLKAPTSGPKKAKQLPKSIKRKQNPNVKSASITSFFKRAAH